MVSKYLLIEVSILAFVGCGNHEDEADAYGNFSADEIIISSETAGRILKIPYSEGQQVISGEVAFELDSTQAFLKVRELIARKKSVSAKLQNIDSQIEVYQKQKSVITKELNRFKKMLEDGAATRKQIDDLEGQIEIIDKQVKSVETNSLSVKAEIMAMEIGIEQAKDMLEKTKSKFLTSGTILEKHAEVGELASPGKPIYKMARLDTMKLTAYISGNQLSAIKLWKEVKVSIDNPDGTLKDYVGKISWVSSQAEFTPKNIQTREERLTQVYAIRILVPNDGSIKINMPGEVRF